MLESKHQIQKEGGYRGIDDHIEIAKEARRISLLRDVFAEDAPDDQLVGHDGAEHGDTAHCHRGRRETHVTGHRVGGHQCNHDGCDHR
jgi:hypothetical protein